MKKMFLALFIFVFMAQSAVAAVSEENFVKILRETLRNHPELVMDILRENSESVLDIAQQGSNLRRKRSLEAQWREDMKVPKKVAMADRPVRGAQDAPVTIIAFSDFTCVYCQQAAETVERLLKAYKGRVRFVFKQMPHGKDNISRLSSDYFVAIALQDAEKAWRFYDACFGDRNKLTTEGEAFMKETAQGLGCNMPKLAQDVRSRKVRNLIEEDLADSKRLGAEGTPFFLVNNLVIRGALPYDFFKVAVDLALSEGK